MEMFETTVIIPQICVEVYFFWCVLTIWVQHTTHNRSSCQHRKSKKLIKNDLSCLGAE